MRKLIEGALVLTMETAADGHLKPPCQADIAINGSRIEQVGDVSGEFDERLDASNMLVMPGLVNTHGHAAMSLFRGFGDDLPLMSWLQDKIWPVEAKLQPADVKTGSQLAIVEMLKSGTTAFADMYFFCEQTMEAVQQAGIRASVARGVTADTLQEGEAKLKEALDFALAYRIGADGLPATMLGPHAPYTCQADFLRLLAEAAREHHLPLHIHLAETQDELQQIQQRYGRRPVEFLANCDFFRDNQVLAAHGVWLDQQEISYLASYQVSVAHNPVSNMKLASGLAPVRDLLTGGLNVSLGTDSACSNNNLDMFEEMKAAALLAKTRDLDPLALPAAQALQMATVNGARALGWQHDCGSIEAGKLADLVLVNLDQPHFYPRHDLLSHLVYAASGADVDTVLVGGRMLMHKRELLTLDEEKICYEAERVAQDLCYSRG